jgi:hypothetical protein
MKHAARGPESAPHHGPKLLDRLRVTIRMFHVVQKLRASVDRRTGVRRRLHLHECVVGRAVRRARGVGSASTCHPRTQTRQPRGREPARQPDQGTLSEKTSQISNL